MARSPLLPLLLLGARADIPPARPELGQHTRRRQYALRRRAQAAQAVPLASNALSLNEFNAIRATEAPQDFGGVDSETADGLWGSAIEFEYEVSNTAAELYPHTMCSSQPDMSGDERGAQMTFALESVRSISQSDWRTSDYLFHNTDSVSCGILMASAETVSAVYEWNGDDMEGIEVNPLLGSMKMVAQTVNVIQARMAGTEFGAASVSAASGGADAPGGTLPASQLGLRLVLCPGTEGSGEEIVAGLRGGTSDVGGVVAKSFYSSRAAEDAPITERMDFWTSSVDAVAGMTADDGSNYCVDTLLAEGGMSYRVSLGDDAVDVFSRLSPSDLELGIAAGNFTLDQYNDCMWYAVYALSLDPRVCSVEPEARVTTVCDDGSLDLLGLGCGGGPMSHLTARESNLVDETLYYALSLNEWNAVRSTESPQDFGGLGGEETDGLWTDAARFEYQIAMNHSDDKSSSSAAYHPYVVCSLREGLSGAERERDVVSLFNSTPGVEAGDDYQAARYGLMHNTDRMSCLVMRAYNDTMWRVFEGNPESASYMTVNPVHPSMKMVAQTVNVVRARFAGNDPGDAVSISSGLDAQATSSAGGRIKVHTLGLRALLCPGVADFGGEDVTGGVIEGQVWDFVAEGGGRNVQELSFYSHRVDGGGVHTDRMEWWASSIEDVVASTDEEDGMNFCLDSVLRDTWTFSLSGDLTLSVFSDQSEVEADAMLAEAGRTRDEYETCVWYLLAALAVDPQICSIEPESRVKVLCADGTSDLSRCPLESSTGGPGASGLIALMTTLATTAVVSLVVMI